MNCAPRSLDGRIGLSFVKSAAANVRAPERN